jgi:transcriptional/translational regulatory protein YebC/TACO1
MDEMTTLPKEKVNLNTEDLELFKKVLAMLDDVEDV